MKKAIGKQTRAHLIPHAGSPSLSYTIIHLRSLLAVTQCNHHAMCWSALGVYPGPEEMHIPITLGDTSPFEVFGEAQCAFMATSTAKTRAHGGL